MAAAPRGKGLVALFKQGWNEIPEVLASAAMGLVGIGMAAVAMKVYYDKDGDNRRYKTQYTVIRHDDPMVDRIKK